MQSGLYGFFFFVSFFVSFFFYSFYLTLPVSFRLLCIRISYYIGKKLTIFFKIFFLRNLISYLSESSMRRCQLFAGREYVSSVSINQYIRFRKPNKTSHSRTSNVFRTEILRFRYERLGNSIVNVIVCMFPVQKTITKYFQ